MNLGDEPGLRHDHRQRAVPHLRRRRPARDTSRSLHAACRPGGARARAGACPTPAAGSAPRSARPTIREAFGDGWVLEALDDDHLPRRRSGVACRGARPAGGHRGRRARLARAGPPGLSDFGCAVVRAIRDPGAEIAHDVVIAGVGDAAGDAPACAGTPARRRRGRPARRRGWRRPAAASSAKPRSASAPRDLGR